MTQTREAEAGRLRPDHSENESSTDVGAETRGRRVAEETPSPDLDDIVVDLAALEARVGDEALDAVRGYVERLLRERSELQAHLRLRADDVRDISSILGVPAELVRQRLTELGVLEGAPKGTRRRED